MSELRQASPGGGGHGRCGRIRRFEPPLFAEVAKREPQLEILDLLGAGASGVNFVERFNREALALAPSRKLSAQQLQDGPAGEKDIGDDSKSAPRE